MAVRQASCWRLTTSHCLVMAPIFAVLGPPWHVLCDQFREVAVAGFFLSLLDDQKLLRAECGLIRQPCSSLERTTRFDVQCVGRLAFVLPTWFPLISTGVWLQPCRLWFAKAQPGLWREVAISFLERSWKTAPPLHAVPTAYGLDIHGFTRLHMIPTIRIHTYHTMSKGHLLPNSDLACTAMLRSWGCHAQSWPSTSQSESQVAGPMGSGSSS